MTPLYARELPPAVRASLAARALRQRQDVRPDRAPRDQHEADKFKAADRNKVQVRGRFTPRGLVWDVLRVSAGKVQVVASGCLWQEQAFHLAAAELVGRVSISMHGSGGLFEKRGAVLVPSTDVRPQAQRPVDIRQTDKAGLAFDITPKRPGGDT